MTVLLRGGGDLASGVAYRLHRVGVPVVITELPAPLAVRRMVSFSEAVYEGRVRVEGVEAVLVRDRSEVDRELHAGRIPVVIDPGATMKEALAPICLIDGRMTKRPPEIGREAAPLVIGLSLIHI